MRLALAALILAASATALAEPVPITVAPFSGRCFDATTLAERVRARVEAPVRVGAAPRGSHQLVRVSEDRAQVRIDFTARDERGGVVGSAHRVVPLDDCATALDLATLIVARAALPLTAESTADSRQPTGRKKPPPPATPPIPTTPPPAPAPEPTPEPPPPPPAPAPPPKPQVIIIERPVPTPPPSPPPGTVLLRMRPPDKRLVIELAAAVYGAFGLDANGSDQPAGELSVGIRRGRFGAAIRGSVEGDYSVAAAEGTGVSMQLRRASLAVEAHADIPFRVGALRFVLGPAVPLWVVRPAGVPSPHSTVIPSFAITARLLYHLDIGRIFLTAGVTTETSLLREELTVTGIGPVARTPVFEIGPYLGFGVNL